MLKGQKATFNDWTDMNTTKLISLMAAALVASAGVLVAETVDPILLDGPLPDYSASARAHGLQGTVVVEALVDESGRVLAAEVVESANRDLDKATLAAVHNWTFTPAMEDGKAVMKVVRIPVQFNLVDPLKDSVLRSHDRAIVSK